MAYPIVFTNRAAFDAVVGQYTLLRFDKGPEETRNTATGIEVTYSNLLTVKYDASAYSFLPKEPYLIMGTMGLQSTGVVLTSVTAFGFDILKGYRVSPDSGTVQISGVFSPSAPPSGYDVRFALAGLNFLGFWSDTPFTPTIITGPDASGAPCRIDIDNMALKIVTTSSGVPRPPTGLNVR